MPLTNFRNLEPESVLDIKTESGLIRFQVVKFKHGLGFDPFHFSVYGYTTSRITPNQACIIEVNGKEFGGRFARAQSDGELFLGSFEAIIPDEEFWKDAP